MRIGVGRLVGTFVAVGGVFVSTFSDNSTVPSTDGMLSFAETVSEAGLLLLLLLPILAEK